MFAYLRYFYAISFIVMVAAALALGFVLKHVISQNLTDLTAANARPAMQAYVNSVWKPYFPRPGAATAASMGNFQTASRIFLEDVPMARLTVYSGDGQLVYRSSQSNLQPVSNNAFNVNPSEISGSQPFTARLITSKLANGKSVSIVQAIQRVESGECVAPPCPANIAVIEVLTDVTAQASQLVNLQLLISGGIAAIFLVLIAILFVTSRKAEQIIAKQHEVNLELTAAAASAEAENRDKSQFLANISHELRTPLNAIIGFSEIIKKEGLDNLTQTHKGYVLDINSSGVHLLSLINDILDYSKAEAGKLEVDLDEVDITKLVKNSMRLVIPRAEEAQVMLVEELPPDHFVIVTDAKKLKQVLLNLLSNAVKFTRAGGEVKVSIWEQVVEGHICIEVRDTGIGIAPKDISKVMTPFGQVDSTLARKYEGTGLGLPLSKKFVEILGGVFTIDSEVNVGTTITIRLPRTMQAFRPPQGLLDAHG